MLATKPTLTPTAASSSKVPWIRPQSSDHFPRFRLGPLVFLLALGSGEDKIVEMIQKLVAEDTWNDEGVSISADETKLIVRTYPDVQRQILDVINLLRAAR